MKVSSTEFQNQVGRYQDEALQHPVEITKNGRDHVVLLSAAEYRRLKRRDREVLLAGELSDADLEAVAASKMPPGREHLNEEMD